MGKTVLVRYHNEPEWFIVSERKPIKDEEWFDWMGDRDPADIDVALIFAQPSRWWKVERTDAEANVCFWSSDMKDELQALELEELDLEIDQYFSKDPIVEYRASAMTKRQRNVFNKGAAEMAETDDTVRACLQEEQYVAKQQMFFVGPSDAARQLSSDTNVEVFDPKLGGKDLDVKWKKNLQEQFIKNSPSLIISYLGDQEYTFDDLADYYFLLDDIAAK